MSLNNATEAPDPENVRIITTLGHVDHGKTTLMDTLLAANNIISSRMAGKLRYLDSREDEQERGITMESSAVSLKFHVGERNPAEGRSPKTYIINMIDTPGHVDFSSEVSTSSRLCDGALVLVDVVEGVCTQTITVLRQAWQDNLRPILILNKSDRLITELKLAPIEAYHHLSRLIEQVNAVMGSFFAGERMADDQRWHEERERRLAAKKDALADAGEAAADANLGGSESADDAFQEKDDEDIYFAPERGNVVFASALDGWGFRVGKFAQLYSAKLGFKEATLRRVLWGDFYLDPKTKRVVSYKHLRGRALKPLFVQFVLENLWAVYDAVIMNPNPDKVSKIVSTLNLKILPRDLRSKDGRSLLSLILSQWLSLSTCIIQAAIDVVPSPPAAQAVRVPKMLHPDSYELSIKPRNKLEADLYASNSAPEAAVVAYVSRMFVVEAKDLPENKKKPLTAEELRAKGRQAREAAAAAAAEEAPVLAAEASDAPPAEATTGAATETENGASAETATNEDTDGAAAATPDGLLQASDILIGFARLYSGTLEVGATVHCCLPKYNAALPRDHPANVEHITRATVEGLYTMMGKELIPVQRVRAGNTFAVKGLMGKVWRNATLCAPGAAGVGATGGEEAEDYLINLGGANRLASSIVRIAVEPVVPADMSKLVAGLKLLAQADPCLETFQQQTGEHVIVGAGELHLERCLRDLRDRFARVEIQASKPIVPFRETAVKAPDMAPPKTPGAPRGTIRGAASQNLVSFTIRAAPLPQVILDFILQNLTTLRQLQQQSKSDGKPDGETEHEPDVDAPSVEAAEVKAQGLAGDVLFTPSVKPAQFWSALEEKCKAAGGEWSDVAKRIWAFGPQGAGGCILVDARKEGAPLSNSLQTRLQRGKNSGPTSNGADSQDAASSSSSFDFSNHIETGFQLATFQGPLCAEPVEGMAYFVESVVEDDEGVQKEILQNRLSQVTGSVISAVRDACRNGLLDWSPRLMLAMYSCDIQASTDVLGKVYSVVAKRRGRIVAEEIKEGTSFFTVSALLPVVESFGFALDIRKRTSGAASPQLIFSGYEMLDQDPFWVPTTEEELEDHGEKADRSNVAKAYMDGVRERKGMFVDRKIVEFAEKQRTLKR
ncbi:P-loop containing nucleoside triphosphate hydrolase protein [Coniophora puteana RWD-64-598 SS2]|uniref:Ribosome assembly protein 1 n=1 Tax=Coniophora puteana (strain RWD-64-598) TaxID=741705 RepID=A0A5M3MQ67_CONPW|nr:P-loop containing nucleoside triphosphate hydrolase protein [Coniophora puteana RWD-64-598 SS2]EIW81293.1 P-loop containing nucleoside triphosphate hydrolase protein [Coniophora puteana RWD-64-598 SS2]